MSSSKRLKTLGKGTYGTVYVDPRDKHRVIKSMKFSGDTLLGPANFRELFALSLPPHPDLVRMTKIPMLTRKEIQVQLPKALGDLRTFLPSISTFTLEQLASIMYQIFCGLTALHGRGFIHYDLKPENILLFNIPVSQREAPEIKLADFGLIHFKDAPFHTEPNYLTTSLYRAPEQLCLDEETLAKGREYTLSPAADIFSAGKIMIEMLEAWANQGTAYMKRLGCENPDLCPRESAEELARIFQVPQETWDRYCGSPPYSNSPRNSNSNSNVSDVSNVDADFSANVDFNKRQKKAPAKREGKLTWLEIDSKRRDIPLWKVMYKLGLQCMAFDKTKRPTAKEAAAIIKHLLAESGASIDLPECPKTQPLPEFQPWYQIQPWYQRQKQKQERKEEKSQAKLDPRLENFIHLWALDLSPLDSEDLPDYRAKLAHLAEPKPSKKKSFQEMIVEIPAIISLLGVPAYLVPAAFFALASWIPRESIDWVTVQKLQKLQGTPALGLPRNEDFRAFYMWLLQKLEAPMQAKTAKQAQAQAVKQSVSRKRKVR